MLSMSVFACACIACMHDATISSTAPAVEINNECQFVQATATLRLFMTIPHSVAIRYIPLHMFLPFAAYTVFHWIWMPATFIAGIKRCHNCRHFHVNFTSSKHIFPWGLIQSSPSEDQTGGSGRLNLWLSVVALVRRRRTLRPWPSIGWTSNHVTNLLKSIKYGKHHP